MVDVSELQKASQLNAERMQLARGLEMLNHGMGITSIGIGPPKKEGQPFNPQGFHIPTTHLSPPPQMLDSIKQQAAARLTAIDAELKAIGITVSEPEAKKKKA